MTQPEIERLTQEAEPWFILLRHMDPHTPYLPPSPFSRLFYHGDECDPENTSMEPVFAFKPFADYFRSWMPEGITDRHYMDAQYDGAVAYMDACIAALFTQLETLGILDDTIVVINADHGETLYEHECWYDHHGLYDPTLMVPLIIRYPRRLPRGARVSGFNQHKDLMPTLLQLARIRTDLRFDGQSLLRLVQRRRASFESELYITECTWMRKHGWRTAQWKLIEALEPDFHAMPPRRAIQPNRGPAGRAQRRRPQPRDGGGAAGTDGGLYRQTRAADGNHEPHAHARRLARARGH